MFSSRRVRIANTDTVVTFTQRGQNPMYGFVRLNGKTISGENWYGVFYTAGQNSRVPYQDATN